MTSNSALAPTTDPKQLRRAFGCFPSGVAAVCANVAGRLTGMAVASFTSVSLDPPLVSICIDHGSSTWPKLRQANRIGISVLSDEHATACRRLSSKVGDRFAGLVLEQTAEGAIMIADAAAWFECSIEAEVPAGDHDIVVLRVECLDARPLTAPLVFHGSRFHRLSASTVS